MKKAGKIALGVCLGVVGLGGIAGGLTWYFLNKKNSSSTEYKIKFSGSKHVHTDPAIVEFELNKDIKFTYSLDAGYDLVTEKCTITFGKSAPVELGTRLDEFKKSVTIPKEEVIDKSIEIHFETKTVKLEFTPGRGGDYFAKLILSNQCLLSQKQT